MAADLDTSSNVIPVMVSTRRLEGTLVAPVTVHKVPNHLTDTSKSKPVTYLAQLSPNCFVPMSPKGYSFVPNRSEHIVVHGSKAKKSTVGISKCADSEV